MDERVTQYLRLDFCLFQTTVHPAMVQQAGPPFGEEGRTYRSASDALLSEEALKDLETRRKSFKNADLSYR